MNARVTSGDLKLSDEHDGFAWVPLNELSKWKLAEQIRDFMLDYAKRKGTQQ
jgi:hypothetical protein